MKLRLVIAAAMSLAFGACSEVGVPPVVTYNPVTGAFTVSASTVPVTVTPEK